MTLRSSVTVSPARPCPVCGCIDRRPIHRQRFLEPEGEGFLGGYEVCGCTSCGFTYADGLPSQQMLDAYYRERSKYEYADQEGRESPQNRARFNGVADLLEKHFPDRNIRILEIGASTGGFLAVMTERGYTCLLGLDPSPACAKGAKRLYGVRVEPWTIDEALRRETTFDLAVALAVLEHVRDLQPFLAKLCSSLGPDGALFVQVPDVEGFSDFPGAPFQEFSTEHINYFSAESLRNLMGRVGMEQRFVERTCVPESCGVTAPVLNALYRRGAGAQLALSQDAVSVPALTRYVEKCKGLDDHLRAVLRAVAARGQPVLVWGTGTHTQRLLAEGALAGVNIAAYADSNPHMQGRTLGGKVILVPDAVKGRSEPILISSQVFQREIEQLIRHTLGLSNEIITLYSR